MPLRYLFVDMNSFFASVEQQYDPTLRGRPVAVVPVMADSSCCIAASVEAKRFGVRTGTPVWQAKKLCSGLILVKGKHDRYIRVHEKIVAAVGRCVPVAEVRSIDEMCCDLIGREREEEAAIAIARRVKGAIRRHAGDWLRCSVGIGPNRTLAKLATDMQKPDGLVVIRPDDLPHALHHLTLTDFVGIGPRMERRFHAFGITTVQQLLALTPAQLCTVWGSRVHGWRWWYLLRGHDVPDKPTQRRTVGHSHILPPELRHESGARGVVVRLVHKAAARLRKMEYWAGAVVLTVDYKHADGWAASAAVPACQDTLTLLVAVAGLWERKPAGPPFKVGVTFTDLAPARSVTPSLFPLDRQLTDLSHAMDQVNRAFGPNTVYFGGQFGHGTDAPMRVAFTHIPDEETESADVPRRYGWG